MSIRSSISSALTVGTLTVVVIIVIGYFLGQPILLGFVTTGSMSPTIEPGDGFIAVPPALMGGVDEGDVVTFDAQEIEGGELTTHRIVDQTREGYITKGDANPFTDQDASEPPVLRTQIVAVALEINGEVVVIPEFGTAVMAIQGTFESVTTPLSTVPGLRVLVNGGLGSVMIGLGLFILALSFVGDLLGGNSQDRSRSRSREGVLSAFLLLLLVLGTIIIPVTASMVVPAGTNDIQVLSSSAPTDDPTIIEQGGSQEWVYNGTNSGFLPRIVILQPGSGGVQVSNPVLLLRGGESASTNVTISVPDEPGVYPRAISESHYVQVLPTSVIVSLHNIHPWVAILVINLVLAVAVTVIFVLTVGLNPIRMRSTGRDISTIDRLKQMLP